jgi:S-DNA-T family DNA segregation ATPase FtsK/SpoIIIE
MRREVGRTGRSIHGAAQGAVGKFEVVMGRPSAIGLTGGLTATLIRRCPAVGEWLTPSTEHLTVPAQGHFSPVTFRRWPDGGHIPGVTTTMTNVRARVGRRTVLIHPASGGETAAELAAAVGLGSLCVDGRRVPDTCPLIVSGLVDGSELTDGDAGPIDTGEQEHPESRWVAAVVTGPDCGGRTPLTPGRHIIGRARSALLRVDDPRLEPHHAVVDVGGDAADEVELLQLAGSVAIQVDRTAAGTTVSVGASRVELRPTQPETEEVAAAGPSRISETSPWHRDHHRPLRPPAPPLAAPIGVPDRAPAIGTATVPAAIVPAVLAAFGTAVIAIVLHQPLILLFGLSAVLVAAGTWAAQHVSRLRRARVDRTDRERITTDLTIAIGNQATADASWLRQTSPDVGDAIERITAGSPRLWERRPEHGDAWRVVLGRGEQPWRARFEVETVDADLAVLLTTRSNLADVPIAADVGPGTVLGISGRAARGVARATIVQLAANCGPADWELLIVTDRPEDWRWTSWLPHDTSVVTAADAASAERLGAPQRDRHVLVIVDAPGALSSRTAPLRRLLAGDPRPAAIVLADDTAALPSFCTSVLGCGSLDGAEARWFTDPTAAELPIPVQTAAITIARATSVAARLAHRRDPEVEGAAGAAPRAVGLMSALGDAVASAEAIARGWDHRGIDPPPSGLIGAATDGTVEIDLCRDGPHALIGGTTGAGKSELLRTMLVGLAVASPPDLLSFVLVDYKGGAAFDACADLPHVAGIVTDLDEHLAARALRSLDAELRRRERLLRDVGASDLTAYRTLTGGREPLARLVVVVDEFATLATELPTFLASLVSVAQRGRSLGVHLVLATQRPGAAINDDIRANTNLRIALRVQDPNEAMDVAGDRAPAAFDRRSPGRAMLRLGTDERVVFQVAATGGPITTARTAGLEIHVEGERPRDDLTTDLPSQLATLVARIGDAASGRAHARPVWAPVLPAVVTADDVAMIAPPTATSHLVAVDVGGTLAVGNRADPCVGIIDDPDAQRRRPLRWQHRDGHLVVAGTLGSGTTSAALAVVRGLAAQVRPEALHVYVLDGRGDPGLRSLAGLPHCGGVVGVADAERLERTVRLLHARTRSRPSSAADVVVVVDGLPALRSAVDAIGGDLHERFDDVLADGPAAGVTVLATTDQPVLPLALTARATQRWIMRLADPTMASLLDVSSVDAIGPDAPPGRLVALPERLEAQVVAPVVAAAWPPVAGIGPAPIGLLPTHVPADGLPPGRRAPGRTLLPLGLGATELEDVTFEIADGDHLLVLGSSRSGRSTALVRLVVAWSQAHPDGSITTVTPRRSPLAAVAGERAWANAATFEAEVATTGRHLLVVDDAELIEHPALAAMCATAGVTVLAASRPDALRGIYGHWTQVVRRSRTGLVLGRTSELDGDLLGVVLPRRRPAPSAPGRGWLVIDGACQGIVQLATDVA